MTALRWTKNIDALRKKNVILSEILTKANEAVDHSSSINYYNENGMDNMSYALNGHNYYLHSRINPVAEASKKVKALDLSKSKVVFVLGIGCGYHVSELQKQVSEDCTIVIIEPILDILLEAMKNADLESVVAADNTFVLCAGMSEFGSQLEKVLLRISVKISGMNIFMLESSKNIFEEDYIACKNYVMESIILVRKKLGNLPVDSLEGLNHLLVNSKYLIESPNCNERRDVDLSDIPVISVASGPSLDKNLHLLKEIGNKAIIVCADSAYDKLLSEGIKPHIITVLERDKPVYDKLFEGKSIDEDVMLLGEGLIYPKIFDCFKGKKVCVLRDHVYYERLFGKCSDTTQLNIGPSVANLNISVAKMIASKCLILIGQDLAYSESGKSHAGGTVHEKNTIEMDQKSGNSMHQLKYVEDIHGNPIATTSIWEYFLRYMETEIKESKLFVVDATEGGAKIDGTEIMSLREAIDLYCGEEMNVQDKLNEYFSELDDVDKRENFRSLKKLVNDERRKFEEILDLINVNADRLSDFNIPRVFDGDRINEQVIPVNHDINIIASEYKMFFNVVQSNFINLGNFNSLASVINEENVEVWLQKHSEFFEKLRFYVKICMDIFDGSEALYNELEEVYER